MLPHNAATIITFKSEKISTKLVRIQETSNALFKFASLLMFNEQNISIYHYQLLLVDILQNQGAEMERFLSFFVLACDNSHYNTATAPV